MALRLSLRQGRAFFPAGGQTRSAFLHSSVGSTSFSTKGNTESTKQPLKKPKTPVGRFDEPEESSLEKEPLESKCSSRKLHNVGYEATEFPDDINPMTKEKGGPRGPEPTRYGDWERKGRCIDF